MKEKITVVWGIDKKYLLQAFVVMHSVLKNSKEEYSFYILSADEIKNEIDTLQKVNPQYIYYYCPFIISLLLFSFYINTNYH